MSLPDFQRAFAVVVGDPETWLARLARPAARVRDLQLSDQERERLRRILLHPGMAANHLLLRSNRWMPIQSALPLTCDWLRSDLQRVLDAWLANSEDASVQYQREAERFANWLPGFIRGKRPHPALDALRYEQALAALVRLRPESLDASVIAVEFQYHPDDVLGGWSLSAQPLDRPMFTQLRVVDQKIVLDLCQ